MIQALKAILFFSIHLSLLVQAFKTSSLICCPLLLVDQSFITFLFLCCPLLLIDPNVHSIFIIFVVFSFLLLQAFKAFSFYLQIFFNNLFCNLLFKLCKDFDHCRLLYCWCLCFTLLPRHDFLFHFEVARAMQNFTGHQSFSSISSFVLFLFLLLFSIFVSHV